ncbi:MAG: YbjN domain-containing protein [Rhodobacteraceae bacterium]|nr:YbjN domain-containing protein [Paracoccaceae bacterium]
MTNLEEFLEFEEVHPIDIVETIAEKYDWEFDRLGENQISMLVEGQWRTYSVTLAWSHHEQTLWLISTFEMELPKEKLGSLYEILNLANDECWIGSFIYWAKQKVIAFRYGLVLGEEVAPSPEQINKMLDSAINVSEQFYPAFQLVCWGDRTPNSAMQLAIAEAIGHA